MWDIPRLFGSPHRKLLRLEVNKIEIDTLRKISRLIDKGFNVRIFNWTLGGCRFSTSLRDEDLSQILDVVDHASEGELRKRDKQGFFASPSSFISRLFCRR